MLYPQIPRISVLPWVAPHVKSTPQAWTSGQGPLEKFVSTLKGVIRGVSDDYVRHCENKYIGKLLPRNIFYPDVWEDKLSAVPWDMSTPRTELDPDTVMSTMYHDGLGRTKSGVHIFSVVPPDGATALGPLYVPDAQEWTSGQKKEIWASVMRMSSEGLEWIMHQGFTWDNIDGRAKEVIVHFNAIYVPNARLDRGWNKVRLLFQGNTVMYVLETAASQGIKCDMRQSVHYGYLPDRGVRASRAWGNRAIISGDCAAFDLHNYWGSLKSCWRAWQIVYDLPETLMCALYAYNVYAPIARWDVSTKVPSLKLQARRGLSSSGSGAFVIINNLFMRSMMCSACSSLMHAPIDNLDTQLTGLSFGDDHVIPMPTEHLLDWVRLFRDFGHDVSESEVNVGRFKFLRMLYGPSYERQPIVFSRFRNACCPEDPGIESRSELLNAVALRAQLVPFAVFAQISPRWKQVYDAMSSILVPHDELLMHQYPSDADLVRDLNMSGGREIDSLFYAKRVYQVEDSGKVL